MISLQILLFFIKIKLSKYRYYFIFSSFKNLVWLLKIKCINEPPQTARGQTDQIWKRSLKGRLGRGKTQNIVEIILLEKFTCRRICFDLWKQEMYHLHSKHTCHVRWKRPKNYISYCSVEINMSLACEYVSVGKKPTFKKDPAMRLCLVSWKYSRII